MSWLLAAPWIIVLFFLLYRFARRDPIGLARPATHRMAGPQLSRLEVDSRHE